MKTSHTVDAPRRYRNLIPDRRSALILADKNAFQSYMAENGLMAYAPTTYASSDEAIFPCVVKRLDLSASVGVEIAASRAHLAEILQSGLFSGHPSLLQALVPGILEYATFCICDGGRILWDSTFVSTMSGPAVIKNEDNGKDRRIVTTPVEVLKQFETVLAPLNYRGPCVIDYKIADDGRVRIFEINPRLGGTLLLKSNAWLLRQALGHILAAAR
jgi:carbamoylphosphate synthase large subunit